jgi:hypothetical protein
LTPWNSLSHYAGFFHFLIPPQSAPHQEDNIKLNKIQI